MVLRTRRLHLHRRDRWSHGVVSPDEDTYRAMLRALFGRASYQMTLQRQAVRQITGAAQVSTLMRQWAESDVMRALTPYQEKEK